MNRILRLVMHLGHFVRQRLSESGDRDSALLDGIRYLTDLSILPDGPPRRDPGRLAPDLALNWAECGFPIIEPSHKLAASLMATSAVADDITNELMPWKCFAVEVPDGILAPDSFGEVYRCVLVYVRKDGGLTLLEMCNERWGSRAVAAPSDLSEMSEKEERSMDDTSFVDLDYEQRSRLLLSRLIIGSCIEMQSRTVPSSRSSGGRSQREGPPAAWRFKMTRPVKLDVRQAVRDFSAGVRHSAPSVQVLIRGFWRHQPYGPRSSLRKLIHIEPFWRGPEDAPVAVRRHQL